MLDECAVLQLRVSLPQFVLGVHHDGPIPGYWLLEWPARHQQEADPFFAGGDDDFVAAVEEHERAIPEHRRPRLISDPDKLGLDSSRLGRVPECARPGKHIRERMS